MTGWDIIGDIHGHADELVELLTKLGYTEQHGCFRHASRKVVFCGDFIDRGPQIPDAVRIARRMTEDDAALAVMGNHEFNALAFHTTDPATGQYFRPHSDRNVHQHAETLRQFDRSELNHALEWFATLPPALDLGHFRVVHACWDAKGIDTIHHALQSAGDALNPTFLGPATRPGDELFDAVERVLKGPELPLPNGVTVMDKEGHPRRRIRIRWFDEPAGQRWNSYSLPVKPELASDPVPADAPAVPYCSAEPPVFVGHYWLPDAVPSPLRENVACLDYSIARDGFLTAYRFDGEQVLSPDRFVQVPSRDRKAES